MSILLAIITVNSPTGEGLYPRPYYEKGGKHMSDNFNVEPAEDEQPIEWTPIVRDESGNLVVEAAYAESK
jgi:hypothetical protein